jgi:hypothetical protein
MKKLILLAAACLVASPALGDSTRSSVNSFASRGGVANSATVSQSAGAFAFSQVAQGERAVIDAPRFDPLIRIEPGAFVMPYVNESFNASRGGDVRVFDPIGSVELD